MNKWDLFQVSKRGSTFEINQCSLLHQMAKEGKLYDRSWWTVYQMAVVPYQRAQPTVLPTCGVEPVVSSSQGAHWQVYPDWIDLWN